ncbi:MAG TPA: hypothetical protein VF908_03635 [Gemmatimonadaceae bacterium]
MFRTVEIGGRVKSARARKPWRPVNWIAPQVDLVHFVVPDKFHNILPVNLPANGNSHK